MEQAGSGAAKQQLQNCSLRLAERQTRGGGCFHLVVFARPRCNNQPADCLTAKALPRELKTGRALYLGLFYPQFADRLVYISAHILLLRGHEMQRFLPRLVWRGKCPRQSLPLFAVNYPAHLWLQQHWQLSRLSSVRCVYFRRLSAQKTKRGPVGRLCVGLPVSTQSGPQRRICRPDRIKPLSLFTQQWWG